MMVQNTKSVHYVLKYKSPGERELKTWTFSDYDEAWDIFHEKSEDGRKPVLYKVTETKTVERLAEVE